MKPVGLILWLARMYHCSAGNKRKAVDSILTLEVYMSLCSPSTDFVVEIFLHIIFVPHLNFFFNFESFFSLGVRH